MKIFIYIFLLAAPVACALADTNFDEGNRLFSEGKYAEAAAAYQNLLDRKGSSAELLYNLANAQLKTGQAGEAILNYERALNLFSPRDPDILANLKMARNEAGILEPETNWLQNMAHFLTWDSWAWLSLATLTVLCLLMGIRFGNYLAPWIKHFRAANAALIIVFIVAVFGLFGRWTERNRAVVISEKAIVRISPFETAEVSFPVKTGEIVKFEQTYGNFISIRNRTGKSGWILKNQVEKIVP